MTDMNKMQRTYNEFYETAEEFGILITPKVMRKKDQFKKSILEVLSKSLLNTMDSLSLLWSHGLEEGCGKGGPVAGSAIWFEGMLYNMAIAELEHKKKIEFVNGNWRLTGIDPSFVNAWNILSEANAFFIEFGNIKHPHRQRLSFSSFTIAEIFEELKC